MRATKPVGVCDPDEGILVKDEMEGQPEVEMGYKIVENRRNRSHQSTEHM